MTERETMLDALVMLRLMCGGGGRIDECDDYLRRRELLHNVLERMRATNPYRHTDVRDERSD